MIDIDVLCIGATTYDMVFEVPYQPEEDDKIFANNLTQCGGGPASNAAVLISRLGFKSAFIGYLGNDLYGKSHFAELVNDNVNIDFVQRGNNPTPLSAGIIKPDGKRTLINYRGPKQFIEKGKIEFDRISPKVILLDGHEPEVSYEAIKFARKRNIPTILDAGSVHTGTELLFDKVDYLITSEKFATTFCGDNIEPLKMADELYEYSPNVIITLGNKGLVWKNKKGNGILGAFKVNAKDSTGAGDAFHGAFATALIIKKDWQEILQYASAAGALTCLKHGARPSLPNKNQLEKFMNENSIFV